jgi:GT2 family glycosyltransferase
MSNIKLSVVIVSYNTAGFLRDCLQSIYQYQPKQDFEVIVVDNASKDNSVKVIENDFPFVRLLKNSLNLGYAKANNMGIKLSRGEYVLLLNSDTLVLPDTLNEIIEYLDSHPVVGIIGPKLLGENRQMIQMSWSIFPSIGGEIIQKFISPKYISKYALALLMAEHLQKRERKAQVTGAAMTIRKKVFEDIGLLDENFFLYFEEPDFCTRTQKRGWDIVFNPNIKVIHRLGASMKKSETPVNLHYRRSQLYFYQKHHSGFQQGLLKLYLLVKFYGLKILHPADKAVYNQIIKLVKEYGKKHISD